MVFEPCCFDLGYGLCTLLLNVGMSGVKRGMSVERAKVRSVIGFGLGLKW